MSSQQIPEKKKHRKKMITTKTLHFLKELPDLILDFRNTVILIIIWMFISEFAGHSVFDLLRSLIKLIIYPINWLLFKTRFDQTGIPEVFIILVPLMLIVSIGFLMLISTEN